MDRQRTFFDVELSHDLEIKRLARRTDPETSHRAANELVDSGRSSEQSQRILERLRQGLASSAELAEIALKYTSRISDLRRKGHTIESLHSGGVWYYRLLDGAKPCDDSAGF